MNGFKWCLSLLIALGVIGAPLAFGASILTLTTNPISGAIAGAPGQTIGWGFTLANSSDNFALISSADFCGGIISSPCSTPLGAFTDFIAQFNFTLINPHSSLSNIFNPITHTGIGSYAINASAIPGSSFLGQIVLTYDTFTDATLNNQIGFDDRVTAAASVSAAAVQTPEPSSISMVSIALLGFCMISKQRYVRFKQLRNSRSL
jgi:hypothetical protein